MSEGEIERLRRELKEAQGREEQERRAKERERRKNQKTTLQEYLYNCHFHLYTKLSLADASRSSTGFTAVDGKYYPKWLRPWNDFKNTYRRQHFEAIKTACRGRRLFHQESTTRDIGSTISRKQAGNENAIDHFEKLAVEDPVWEILRPVWENAQLRRKYRCTNLRFSNNRRDATAAGDRNQSTTSQGHVQEGGERRRQAGPSKRVASERRFKPPPSNPDVWVLRTHFSGDESHAVVSDYKAAHKFSAEAVTSAVEKETLFMEVMQRICSHKAVSDSTAREGEKAEEAVAMALTQVFDYMVRYGVGYGYVAAGASLLLLHVDQADLQTLYCHACEPEEDVGVPSDGRLPDGKEMYTAVAQLASFCLLSLLSDTLRGPSLEEALQKAGSTLRTWREPYEDVSSFLNKEETKSPSDPSSQEAGSNYTSSVSPANRKFALRSKASCKSPVIHSQARDEDEDEDEDDSRDDMSTKVQRQIFKRKDGPSSSSSEGDGTTMSSSLPTRQYCTQACLLGLKRGLELDHQCPNVHIHRTAKAGNRHPISAETFTRWMCRQLRKDPYRKCNALDGRGKGGSTGMLFKLELEPYGYTLVAKGALSGHPRDLKKENVIYGQLERLQGHLVPVNLGLVKLDRGHVLAGGTWIFHMMLMSWGGEEASRTRLPDLAVKVRRSSQAIWAEGVKHGDERGKNQLWNEERGQVMIIDFDQASLLPPPQNKLLQSVKGKKRKRDIGTHESRMKRAYCPSQARVSV